MESQKGAGVFAFSFGRIITNGYAFSTLFAAVLYLTENSASYPPFFSLHSVMFFIYSSSVTIACDVHAVRIIKWVFQF